MAVTVLHHSSPRKDCWPANQHLVLGSSKISNVINRKAFLSSTLPFSQFELLQKSDKAILQKCFCKPSYFWPAKQKRKWLNLETISIACTQLLIRTRAVTIHQTTT